MGLRPPSLSKEYDEFYSGDPALIQPPDPPKDEAQNDAYLDARKEYDAKLRVARETGQWQSLVVPGEAPTIFKLRPIPGELYRALLDKLGGGGVGPGRLNAQLFRCAVRGVTNLKDENGLDIKIDLVPNPIAELREHGKIASPDIVDYLDGLDVRIVTELGELVFVRASRIPPKQ
jgi:hypothetical protein